MDVSSSHHLCSAVCWLEWEVMSPDLDLRAKNATCAARYGAEYYYTITTSDCCHRRYYKKKRLRVVAQFGFATVRLNYYRGLSHYYRCSLMDYLLRRELALPKRCPRTLQGYYCSLDFIDLDPFRALQ